MPTPSRASFIIVNMARSPWSRSPPATRSRRRSSSRRWRCRGCPSSSRSRRRRRAFRAPTAPSAAGMNFGTTKSEMPLVPSGAPSIRASTRWTMFSREVVLAGGDEDLGAGDGVAAVGVGRCPRPDEAEVGAGLRLGQVHGAGPCPRHQLRQVGALLLVAAVEGERGDRPLRQAGIHAEGHVGRGDEFVHRRREHVGQALPAIFRVAGKPDPAARGVVAPRLAEAGGRRHRAVVMARAALDVADPVERREPLLGEARRPP